MPQRHLTTTHSSRPEVRWPIIGAWISAAIDLVVPVRCAGCRTPGASPCIQCWQLVATSAPRPIALGRRQRLVVATCEFDGVARRLITRHKTVGGARWARALGEVLAAAVGLVLAHAGVPDQATVVLVPVPSTDTAFRRRGRRPMQEIADSAARSLRSRRGIKVQVVDGLRHRREVLDQRGLSAAQRRRNLAGAIGLRAQCTVRGDPPVYVVVVDDVVTTGATMQACLSALAAVESPQVRLCGGASVAAVGDRSRAYGSAYDGGNP